MVCDNALCQEEQTAAHHLLFCPFTPLPYAHHSPFGLHSALPRLYF